MNHEIDIEPVSTTNKKIISITQHSAGKTGKILFNINCFDRSCGNAGFIQSFYFVNTISSGAEPL
jgi:hypothetical protein